ncbi:undecaprenyl-phosphate galactose phosphotransferase WbaP [Selenomonas sp. KH1T6]|uniref:undecaprenyl-phosphate galactose phosphotransferase WbaP n=1 Tax=Selenomonas sp. KH1T6 TaxID=3158784 RepID=UPI0008A8053D|nr:undecaprenyl-phosphate galactose phosphotransferase [Selenomonas ruminantium]
MTRRRADDETDLQEMRLSSRERHEHALLPLLLMGGDYLAVVLAETMALYLRRYLPGMPSPFFDIPDMYFFLIVPVLFLCFLHVMGTYLSTMAFWQLTKKVFYAVLYAILMILMLMYFGKVSAGVSRLFVGFTWIFSFTSIISLRYVIKRFLCSHNLLQIPVLFVGAGKTAELVLKSFHRDTGYGYRVIGFLDDHPVSAKLAAEYPILGKFSDVERIVRETAVDHVIITAPGLSNKELLTMVDSIQPFVKHISFVPDFIGLPVGNLEVGCLVDESMMVIGVKNNLASVWNRFLKRVFDLTVSLIGMTVAFPVGLIIALAIYIDSPGPVVFAHLRIGQRKKVFPCYKFRTMVPDAEEKLREYLLENPEAMEEWEEAFKLKEDPRITRVGRFLRKTSLDELPQLINVLKGEMSLVGPRPIVRREIIKYGEYFRDFILVPPGITGMWQVNGRSDTTYEERVHMDSWYVRNWSVWIDLIYLLKTVRVVFSGKGAY